MIDERPTLDQTRDLIGDRIPSSGSLPAAWWLTTDEEQLAAFDRWVVDHDAHRAKIRTLITNLGIETDALINGHGTSTVIVGLVAPRAMTLWPDSPNYQAPPPGWYVNKKSGYLMPRRQTKKDRESQANREWAAIRHVPNVRAYLSGLPTEIYLQDRDWGGGTAYGVNYRRDAQCVWAYSGGDPDRQQRSDGQRVVIKNGSENAWQRMPLSILATLMEEKRQRRDQEGES